MRTDVYLRQYVAHTRYDVLNLVLAIVVYFTGLLPGLQGFYSVILLRFLLPSGCLLRGLVKSL